MYQGDLDEVEEPTQLPVIYTGEDIIRHNA